MAFGPSFSGPAFSAPILLRIHDRNQTTPVVYYNKAIFNIFNSFDQNEHPPAFEAELYISSA